MQRRRNGSHRALRIDLAQVLRRRRDANDVRPRLLKGNSQPRDGLRMVQKKRHIFGIDGNEIRHQDILRGNAVRRRREPIVADTLVRGVLIDQK